MKALKSSLIVAATVGALVALVGANPAAADPIFTIDPASIPGTSGLVTHVTATDISLLTDATITQQSGAVQTEVGVGQVTGFSNGGSPIFTTGIGLPTGYNLFINFQATVNGVSGFSAAALGTIAPAIRLFSGCR